MANQAATRFGYIMNRLNVRSGDLIENTGLDKTLVSRWKNGRRKLSPTSVHTQKIADYLLQLAGAPAVIERTLVAYGLDESSGALRENFIFWLSEQEMPTPPFKTAKKGKSESEYTASFNVFTGNEGLIDAMLTLMDYVVTLPPGKQVVAVLGGEHWRITHNPHFLTQLIERCQRAFERGMKLTVYIHNAFESRDIYDFSGPWLAANLKGLINSRYFEPETSFAPDCLMAAVKDEVCIRTTHDETLTDNLYTAMYTDSITVNQAYRLCEKYQPVSAPLFQYEFLQNPGDTLNRLEQTKITSAPLYLFSRLPHFGAMDPTSLDEYTGIGKKNTARHSAAVSPLFALPEKFSAPVHHVYCLDDLTELVSLSRKRNPVFSCLFQNDVYYSSKKVYHMLRIIKNQFEKNPSYHLALVPRRIFDGFMMNAIASKGNFYCAWLDDASGSTCVTDPGRSGALCLYAERVYEDIPKYHKDRRRVLKLLDELIETVKSKAV